MASRGRIGAQSAVEFFTTYVWTIVLITVVLGMLFYLGVFRSAGAPSTVCISRVGFLCQNLSYSFTDGNVVATVGQNTGKVWTSWAVAFVPQGTPLNSNGVAEVAFATQASPSLHPGQTATVFLPASGPVNVGAKVDGDLWVCYTTGASPVDVSVKGSCGASASYAIMGILIATASSNAMPASTLTTSVSTSTTTTSVSSTTIITAPSTTIPVPSLSIAISDPSNAIADVGQYESFNGEMTNGAAPYTVWLYVANSASPNTIVYSANAVFNGTSWSFNGVWINDSRWATNSTLVASAVVVDSGARSANSPYTNSMTVHGPLYLAFTANESALYLGWSQVLNATAWTGQDNQTYLAYNSGVGTAPFTMSYQVYDPTGAIAYNAPYYNMSSFNSPIYGPVLSNTLSFVQGLPIGAWTANFEITDSASTPATLTNSLTYYVFSVPTAALLTPSNSVLDLGQSVTYNLTIAAGAGPFTVNLVASNGAVVNTLRGQSNGIVTFGPIIPSLGAHAYNAIVKDIATASVFNSVPNTITVNPAMASTSWTVSNSELDDGQLAVFNSAVSGGTAPYTYNFLLYNSFGPCNSQAYVSSDTSNAYAWRADASECGTGTLTANVEVTDGATTPTSVSNTLQFALNAAFGLSYWTQSNSILDAGQYQTLSAGVAGGKPSYAYNILVYGPTGTLVSNALYPGKPAASNSLSFAQNPSWGSGTFTANIIVTDSATARADVAGTLTYAVYPAPTATSLTPSVAAPSVGQSVTYNVLISGGRGPFTVNLLDGATVVNTLTGQSAGRLTFGSYSPSLGTHTFSVSAVDTGTASPYAFVSSSNTISVGAASSSVSVSCSPSSITVGGSTTCTAAVSGYGTPSGTVSFSTSGSGSFSGSPCTLSSGSCHATYTGTASGSPTITATYGGDSNNAGGSGTTSLTVGTHASSVAVSCSPNPVTVGSGTTCTAAVSGYGTPTGSVTFSGGSGSYSGNPCTLSSGSCGVTFTPSAAGNPTITASYGGDSNNAAGSGTNSLTVTGPPYGLYGHGTIGETCTTSYGDIPTSCSANGPLACSVTGYDGSWTLYSMSCQSGYTLSYTGTMTGYNPSSCGVYPQTQMYSCVASAWQSTNGLYGYGTIGETCTTSYGDIPTSCSANGPLACSVTGYDGSWTLYSMSCQSGYTLVSTGSYSGYNPSSCGVYPQTQMYSCEASSSSYQTASALFGYGSISYTCSSTYGAIPTSCSANGPLACSVTGYDGSWTLYSMSCQSGYTLVSTGGSAGYNPSSCGWFQSVVFYSCMHN